MPSDSSGNYSLPAGYLAVAGTTIQPSEHNPPFEDVAAGLTARLMRSGAGAMTGQLKAADGSVGAPGITFGSALSTGIYKTTAGFGVAISGALVAEFGAAGILSGVTVGAIPDNSITLPKLAGIGVGRLLGSNNTGPINITGAANNGAGLVRLTVTTTVGMTTGNSRNVTGVVGTTEANGRWSIIVIDGTHVDLSPSTFVNAYVSGGTIGGGIDNINLGSGLTMVEKTLSASAPSLAGAFGLFVANNAGTPNTKIDIVADQVIMLAGAISILASAVSLIGIDTSTTGANALDTGSRAVSTWYHIFIISNGAATAGLVSLSATAPTMPSGYTYLLRVGAMLTDGSGNFLRTRQLGSRTTYTATLPTLKTGTFSFWTAVAVAGFVPSSATQIKVIVAIRNAGLNTSAAVAPNNAAYSTSGNDGLGWVLANTSASYASSTVEMNLEGANVYYGSNAGSGGSAVVYGWTDKVNAS